MKKIMTNPLIVLAALPLGLALLASAQPEPSQDAQTPPASQNNGSDTNTDDTQQTVGDLIQAVTEAQQAVEGKAGDTNGTPTDTKAPRSLRGQGTRGTAGSGTNAQSLASLITSSSTNHADGTKGLRLNFRNAPLSLVLDYLSEAAGFTISANSKVDLKGTVTVWSNQTVDRNEAIALLNTALTSSGYAATVEGNLLNIYVMDATTTPIVAGVPDNNYTNIAATKDLVTQIVYVRNVEATPLITSLQPLMPTGSSMTANQGANAIVITDTKANIRRMVQLVKALDTTSVASSTLAVFPLTYADATALAQVVTQLFQPDTSSSQQGNRGGPGGGGGPFGRFFGGGFPGGGGGNTTTQQGRVAAPKVTAVADDRSNSLVVSGSEDQMTMVTNLVLQMDVQVDDVSVLRVFRLRYADPQETADQLSTLFPDPSTQQNSRGQGGGFRGFFGGFSPGGNSSSSASQNSRSIKQSRVTAVADPRTGAVIVSAARGLMDEIAGIVTELDSDPAKKKRVFVIPVENRDPQDVVEEIQSVIAADTSGGTFSSQRSSANQSGSQLSTRQQNNLRNQGNNNTANSGFGNNSGSTRRTGQ